MEITACNGIQRIWPKDVYVLALSQRPLVVTGCEGCPSQWGHASIRNTSEW